MMVTDKHSKRFCISVLFALILIGCASIEKVDAREVSFNENYKDIEMNENCKLELVEEVNTLTIGDPIYLWIKNISSNLIEFPPDWETDILFYQEDEHNWVQLRELMEELSTKNIILYPKKKEDLHQNRFSESVVTTMPSFLKPDEPVTVRIVVVGKLIDGIMKNKLVGAYIDVTLHP